jgi:hypothetical protein
MHLDGTIYLALGAKQVAQCEVNFDGVFIDLGKIGENAYGVVGIVRQQIIQPARVIFREMIGFTVFGFFSERLPST